MGNEHSHGGAAHYYTVDGRPVRRHNQNQRRINQGNNHSQRLPALGASVRNTGDKKGIEGDDDGEIHKGLDNNTGRFHCFLNVGFEVVGMRRCVY